MKKKLKMKIFGKVQDVFFRVSAREKAKELGIAGQVSNNLEGHVDIEAEGEEESLKEYKQWCWRGPEHSAVKKIDEEWSEAKGNLKRFEIRY